MKTVPEILKEIRPEFDFATSNDFVNDGMLDSFDMMTLVSTLDKNYSISIQGTDILREARSAEPQAGVQEAASDAGVQAHSLRHLSDISS